MGNDKWITPRTARRRCTHTFSLDSDFHLSMAQDPQTWEQYIADIQAAQTSLNCISDFLTTVFAGEAPNDTMESIYQWKMWEARKQNRLILHWTGDPAECPVLKPLPRRDLRKLPNYIDFPKSFDALACFNEDVLHALLKAYDQPTDGILTARVFRFVSYITTDQ
ncbi:uncharacterized protein FOMMEDRAFT_161954 [Fomitiporia mediterranea MF3/22]|uniref:uncharacterized protein n=1 Tax=Fomitiporia mediterranea (strain MF3/22) TaxID=694068 RepID=UPI0004407D21|nr:uncharacterized protein FOMMEDRAFT_161954 [Fomitiporia mediterranea MF3/22]EJC98203.1 hypothetical protein FOMMEDRAFT_161954 [Fomitiporia mediterranea MF3/22]